MGTRFFNRENIESNGTSPSRYDIDSEIGSGEYATYTVHIPVTPDNQPSPMAIQLERRASRIAEEQYTTNSIFTGGHNCVTRAHVMDKVIGTDSTHPQMAGAKGSVCAIQGCDAKIMSDERGEDLLPCECDFKICRDCHYDAVRTGDGICPGCKEPYKGEFDIAGVDDGRVLTLSSPVGVSKAGEFDQNGWLFETKGTYGYGNAIWPKEGAGGDGGNDNVGESSQLLSKQWRPLTRKLSIKAAILSPYRYNLFSYSFSAEKLC